MAFQRVGNAISVQHALLQCLKTHEMLGEDSPFMCENPAAVIHAVRKQAIKLSLFEPTTQDGFRVLQKIDTDDVQPLPFKRSRTAEAMSPTTPFHVDSGEPSDMSRALRAAELDFEPKFIMPKSSGTSAKHPFASGGLITLQHDQKHWMSFVHGAISEKLSVLITRAMPRAKLEHFRAFQVNESKVEWNDVITCSPVCHVVFTPEVLTVSCSCESGKTWFLSGDVTWTIDTVLAMLTDALKCNFNSLI